MYTKRASLLLLVVCAVALMGLLARSLVSATPEAALQSFYTSDMAEDMLMDPLILAGEKVVPLVIREVKNKNMSKRRYAIAFLGNGSYYQALPGLEEILKDGSEVDYFRADALQAIYLIDRKTGMTQAEAYKIDPTFLGQMAREITGGKLSDLKRRTYFDALIGRHD